ncbi:PilZ domain-containing protein [Thiomicrorhabdus sp. zzn3]|uniref:PilZ domain-containing protein n=1 Tax=Thiomicrorhabdus sp. zzn3 TaxID=3039775 RepID=UPI0024372672|nr:PilZ domain-containing protein [Thiomicrorhabdus sp. zzn3]MDG6777191.1 PilZ domain-containing protein [Thiomicrorhabdus sp. zzn3]
MPVRYFIVPASPLEDCEIYATGVDYFPETVQNKINAYKFTVHHWAHRIQEHAEILVPIFNEMVEYMEFFGDSTKMIAQGRNPLKNSQSKLRLQSHLQGFKRIKQIHASSPKTYQYLTMIEEKYLAFLRSMLWSLEHSSPTQFTVEKRLPQGFKVDEVMPLFEAPKFAKIPLIQTLSSVYNYMNAYLEVFRQIHDDNSLRQHPEEWPVRTANVSASGIAVNLEKRFPNYSNVDVLLYFPEDEQVLQFEGSIVDIRSDEKTQTERIAINFEFPDGALQDYLQTQIQKQEVKECMSILF